MYVRMYVHINWVLAVPHIPVSSGVSCVLHMIFGPQGTTSLRPGHFYLVLTMMRCVRYKHF